MNRKRDLDLGRGCLLKLALFESVCHFLLVDVDLRIIHDFTEGFHINNLFSFVNQDIGILNLCLELLHSIHHLFVAALEILNVNVIDKGVIITAKCLIRNVLRIKLLDQIIIEFIPLSCGILTILAD
jgi:transcription elongation factor GreA-like protein